MEKRVWISLVLLIISVGIIWLTIPSYWFSEPTVTYSENITLAPNETKNITIEAENVRHMAYGFPVNQREQLKVTDHHLNPSPRVTALSIPPAWTWKNLKQNVEINLQMKAALGADPGTYSYTISAWEDLSHENESRTTEQIRVEVTNNSTE